MFGQQSAAAAAAAPRWKLLSPTKADDGQLERRERGGGGATRLETQKTTKGTSKKLKTIQTGTVYFYFCFYENNLECSYR